jgi:hypothetical protein
MIGIKEKLSAPVSPTTAEAALGPLDAPATGDLHHALDPRAREGAALARSPLPVVPEAVKRRPSSAELVEHYDTGKLYLRAYVQGRYMWQEVETEDPAAIPDTGTWIVDSALQDTYWLNHGTYRRRAGKFRSAERQAPAA